MNKVTKCHVRVVMSSSHTLMHAHSKVWRENNCRINYYTDIPTRDSLSKVSYTAVSHVYVCIILGTACGLV